MGLRLIWKRSRCLKSLRSRLAFILLSKIYRQMYANTGIATDSARVNRAATWARLLAIPCRKLFKSKPMPELPMPEGILEGRVEVAEGLVHLGESLKSDSSPPN